MDQNTLSAFVNQAKFEIKPENMYARCVDGRYRDEDVGAIAMPGADEELLEAAFCTLNTLGLKADNEKVLDAVLTTTNGASNFHFHTDDHAEHDHLGTAMGCGHIKHSVNSCRDYGITEDQAGYIKTCLDNLLATGSHQTVLHGNHEEQAVLIVQSNKWSLKPQITDESGKTTQVFVYQATLTDNRLRDLANNLKSQALSESSIEANELFDTLKASFTKELNETVKRLASHLPVYTVEISDTGQIKPFSN